MDKTKKFKNYAFIDSQNLYYGTIRKGWEIDYVRLRNYLRTKYFVDTAYLFIGYIEENKELYEKLENAGYKLVYKPILEYDDSDGKTNYKGNVDAELVLHAMIQYPHYDKAVIVTADGDFYCLVEYLAKKDKLLKIITPNNQYSSLLGRYAEYIENAGDIKEKFDVMDNR